MQPKHGLESKWNSCQKIERDSERDLSFLFTNKIWCDAIQSRMFERGILSKSVIVLNILKNPFNSLQFEKKSWKPFHLQTKRVKLIFRVHWHWAKFSHSKKCNRIQHYKGVVIVIDLVSLLNKEEEIFRWNNKH